MTKKKKPEDLLPKGRPTKYTPELGDKICEQIVSGDSIRTICKPDAMPSVVTFFAWFRTYPEFLKQYEAAKAEQAEVMSEDILDIADNANNDWMEKLDKDGVSIGWMLNGEHVQRSRLRIDSRKWLASKLKPKKYGDSTTIKGDAENPLELNLATRLEKAMAALDKKEEDDKY